MIGRGCSGHVLRAKHHRTDALFAIKVVNNVYDKAKRDQMLTEIRTLYSVESPYLVEFYGAYFRDHALSLVLEYCEAGSLDQLLRKHALGLPERVIAAMAFQMLMGLLHLKQTHHFHRDIKPQNILVKPTGSVKLTDFGIARELGNSQDMAQTFVGTFKYMSPERVENRPYSFSSDIWSLGLVLIESATREFPYATARSYIDVRACCLVRVEREREGRHALTTSLVSVCRSCKASSRAPSRRFQTTTTHSRASSARLSVAA